MDKLLNSDSKVVNEGRKNIPDIPKAGLRDQVLDSLVKKLNEDGMGERCVSLWESANSDRAEWLRKQEILIREYDEFINPLYTVESDWQSSLHMPVTFSICKAFHARMFAALMGQDPPFTCRSRKEANVDRAPLIQDLVRYTLKDWANYYKGTDEVMDRFIWNWVTSGVGIMKMRWDSEFTTFVDVERVPVPRPSLQKVDEATGQVIEVPQVGYEEKDIKKTIKSFEGPCWDQVPFEDLVIINGEGDPDLADAVIHSSYLTASKLWTLADRGVFDSDVVEDVIRSGDNMRSGEAANGVKQARAETSGLVGPDVTNDLDRYQILEAYMSKDVDGSGINSEIIMWVHKQTMKILRATYLVRTNRTMMRPFAKADFHKKEGQAYGVGIPEMIYTLAKEIDAQHNMRLDFGLLSTMPFGYYRATSSMQQERIPISPGALIPLDNPTQDVYFPNLGSRTTFGFQEEASLMSMIERVSSMNDLNFGILSNQGATRTATGTRAVVSEANSNLDIYLRRLNRGFKKMLLYTFGLLQEKLPPGLDFRILGDDGQQYWRTVKSKEEIYGAYDFELEPNSSNSNKQVQLDSAQQVLQLTSNPLDIQLGIVGSQERYEAIKNYLQTLGVKDYSKYLRKPANQARIFTPLEIANRILAGIDIPLDPTQDLQGFIDLFDYFMQHDDVLGQINQEQTVSLAKKAAEARQMLQALQAVAAQQANTSQMQINSRAANATAPGAPAPSPQSSVPSGNPQ